MSFFPTSNMTDVLTLPDQVIRCCIHGDCKG